MIPWPKRRSDCGEIDRLYEALRIPHAAYSHGSKPGIPAARPIVLKIRDRVIASKYLAAPCLNGGLSRGIAATYVFASAGSISRPVAAWAGSGHSPQLPKRPLSTLVQGCGGTGPWNFGRISGTGMRRVSPVDFYKDLILLVGVARFELTTPASRRQ